MVVFVMINKSCDLVSYNFSGALNREFGNYSEVQEVTSHNLKTTCHDTHSHLDGKTSISIT